MAEIRLGDIIDDFCAKCKMLSNHAVVSIVNGEPAKVHCRTCFYEHNYAHGKGVEKRKGSKEKSKLFGEVLSSITGEPGQESEPEKKGQG